MKYLIFQVLSSAVLSIAARAEAAPPEPDTSVTIRDGVVRGFTHPGIGLTKEMLEDARGRVIARQEPWYSGYRKMASHPNSAEKVSCRNQSTRDPSKPDSDAFDNRGMVGRLQQDSDKAYRQSLMYYFTGRDIYRANALNILRTWSKLDPKKCKSFSEDHIHASYPVQTLIKAAELTRYTTASKPNLQWTVNDTEAFTKNFVIPAVTTFFDKNGWFMNQNGYPLAAALAGDVFTNDRRNYEKRVEWFTTNHTAPNKGWSSSITHLARLVDTNAVTGEKLAHPAVQLMEMGRDQAHAGDDVEIFMNTSRIMNAQGTKVDPVTGSISTKPDAVGPYEFLDHRIIEAADYFCRFMLGYDTPWIPAAYDIAPDGTTRAIYPRIADNYRGRIRGFDFWDAWYYETYRNGMDVPKSYRYYHEAFRKRIVASDFDWIHIPKEAVGEAARVPQTELEPSTVEIEQRSTTFDDHAVVMTEGDVGFVRVKPSIAGTRIAILSADTDRKTLWLRFRSTGSVEIEMSGFKQPWLLPDTRGEWRRTSYTMGELEDLGDIVYLRVKGDPTAQLDLDHLVRKSDDNLSSPEFSHGSADLREVAYVGAPVSIDFSAAGSDVRITGQDLPANSTLDPKSGLFQWVPKSVGRSTFVVTASEQDIVAARKVGFQVMADRKAAVEKIAEAHDPEIQYVAAGMRRCKALYDDVLQSLQTGDEHAFYQKLVAMHTAFDQLEPLTPRLPDGSMDFPGIVASSNIGSQIALLTDGNDDTFPVYFLAKDLNYVFDFGDGYDITATAFALEGRLNFENRSQDTAFFGSGDGKTWTRLTREIPRAPTELTRIEVEPTRRDWRFRYLKIQKTNRNSSPLFEPSELRIFGQRHETK